MKYCKGFLPKIIGVLFFQGAIAASIFAININFIRKASSVPNQEAGAYLAEILSKSVMYSIGLLVLGLIVAVAIAFFINKSFLKSLDNVSNVLHKLDEGDLSSRLDDKTTGSICDLADL